MSYFKGVRRELRAGTVQIEIGHQHGEPYGLVEEAIEHQRRAPRREQDRFEAYDQVWCVFDVEAPQPHPRLDAALRLASRHGVHCAVSNPCFELWLLLHFRDQAGYLSTTEACQRLAACPCNYTRRDKQVDYELVRGSRSDAQLRAAHLDERQRETPLVADRNPWTSVHHLVQSLFQAA